MEDKKLKLKEKLEKRKTEYITFISVYESYIKLSPDNTASVEIYQKLIEVCRNKIELIDNELAKNGLQN